MRQLKIRKDRTPVVLRKLAKAEPDARVSRRLLAIANALSGMSRGDALQRAQHPLAKRCAALAARDHVPGVAPGERGVRLGMIALDLA